MLIDSEEFIDLVLEQPRGDSRWHLLWIIRQTGLGIGLWPVARAVVASVIEVVVGPRALVKVVVANGLLDGHRAEFSHLVTEMKRGVDEESLALSVVSQLRIANKRRRLFVDSCLWSPSGLGLPLAVQMLQHWDEKIFDMAARINLPIEPDPFIEPRASDG